MVALVGCANLPGSGTPLAVGDLVGPRAEFEGTPIRPTAAGNYLAGHLAQGNGDWSSAALFMNEALDRDPDNNNLLRRAFLLNVGSGAFEPALEKAAVIAQDPEPLDLALVLLLADAARQDDLETATGLLETISDDGLQRVLKPGIDAWLLAAGGQRDEALQALNGFQQYGGFDALIALHRAFIFDYLGEYDEAEMAYRFAADVSPTLRAGQALGSFLSRQGRIDEAIEVYRGYVARDGSSLLAGGVKRLMENGPPAPGYKTLGDGIGAMLFDFASVLQSDLGIELTLVLVQIATFANDDFPLAQLLLADLLADRDQFADAERVYNQIADDSDIALARTIRLARKYDEADNTERGIRLLQQAVRDYPAEHAIYGQLGDFYRISERFNEAIRAYNRAIEMLPAVEESSWPLFYARGISYERSDRWPLAEADFKRALELQPEQPFVLNYLGYSWADQGVRLAEAEDMIRRAVNLRPNDGFIVDSLGWVLYRLGRYDEAVGYLERAVALSPNDQVINDHLGDALWRVGRRIEARFQWQRAIDIGTDDEVTEAARDKLVDGLTTPPTVLEASEASPAGTSDRKTTSLTSDS